MNAVIALFFYSRWRASNNPGGGNCRDGMCHTSIRLGSGYFEKRSDAYLRHESFMSDTERPPGVLYKRPPGGPLSSGTRSPGGTGFDGNALALLNAPPDYRSFNVESASCSGSSLRATPRDVSSDGRSPIADGSVSGGGATPAGIAAVGSLPDAWERPWERAVDLRSFRTRMAADEGRSQSQPLAREAQRGRADPRGAATCGVLPGGAVDGFGGAEVRSAGAGPLPDGPRTAVDGLGSDGDTSSRLLYSITVAPTPRHGGCSRTLSEGSSGRTERVASIKEAVKRAVEEMQDDLQEQQLQVFSMLGQGTSGTVYHGAVPPSHSGCPSSSLCREPQQCASVRRCKRTQPLNCAADSSVRSAAPSDVA